MLLNTSIRFTIVGLIAIIALASLILSYNGLLTIFTGDIIRAVTKIGWGITLAAAALLLIRYRNDLIDA